MLRSVMHLVPLECRFLACCELLHLHQQSHFLSALLIRLLGSRAVFLLVSFFFMPSILAQKDLRRAAAFGLRLACFLETGALRFMPWRRADALPLRFRPPDGDLPAERCQVGVLAICDGSNPVADAIGAVRCLLFGPAAVEDFVGQS